ncbi:MAG: pyridoxamine 5'-phosphate oxidase family protein [Armatimonadetes bacterium]|nr:pyridoxamine 5'-phosphate oxidase family protein [Armatimonadota bacterium]
MRRYENEVTCPEEIESIIRNSLVCRLAMCGGGKPYVVPLCFGLLGTALYFHGAVEGMKMDILRKNPQVCFEFETDVELQPADASCRVGMKYRSVIGSGLAVMVEDPEEIRKGLEAIARQYMGHVTDFPAAMLEKTAVFRVDIGEMTAKQAGF